MKLWLRRILVVITLFMGSIGMTTEKQHQPLVLVYDSPYNFEETVESLRAAIKAQNFRAFPDRYLEQGLTDELNVNHRQISIRFCNFSELYAALQLEPRLGVLMPCAITVMEQTDGKVQLFANNLVVMAQVFDNPKLDGLLEKVQQRYTDVLEEVTL